MRGTVIGGLVYILIFIQLVVAYQLAESQSLACFFFFFFFTYYYFFFSVIYMYMKYGDIYVCQKY